MQLTHAYTSLLAASTALASPRLRVRQSANQTTSVAPNKVTILLQNQGIELGSGTVFDDVSEQQALPPTVGGPFTQVQILVDAAAPNQGLRCQVLDQEGVPLIATRGENVDITFADGGNGPWTFNDPKVRVSEIVCDPLFVAIGATAFDVTVILQNQGIELGSQTVFEAFDGQEELTPRGSSGPYTTVELQVGELVDPQSLRCQILDRQGRAIEVVRGGNVDTTFADGDAGLWTFVRQSRVSNIICDADFVADPTPVEA